MRTFCLNQSSLSVFIAACAVCLAAACSSQNSLEPCCRVDKSLQGTWVCGTALSIAGSDTVVLAASGELNVDLDRYSLTCRIDSQPNAPQFSLTRDESGTFRLDGSTSAGQTITMCPDQGEEWTLRRLNHEMYFSHGLTLAIGVPDTHIQLGFDLEEQPPAVGNAEWTVTECGRVSFLSADLLGTGASQSYDVDVGGLYHYDTLGVPVRVAQCPRGIAQTGQCRTDGRDRLYINENGDAIHEVGFDGSQWTSNQIITKHTSRLQALIPADIRGDGQQSLYYSDWGKVYESRWSQGTWTETVLGEVPYAGVYHSAPLVFWFAACTIGAGSLPALYGAAYYPDAGGRLDLIECAFDTDSGWSISTAVADLDPAEYGQFRGIHFIPSDCGGPILLFGVTNHVIALSYDGGSWVRETFADIALSGVAVGDVRGDGVCRMYISWISSESASGGVREYTNAAGEWTVTSSIDSLFSPLGLRIVSTGRLYALGTTVSNGYELTYTGVR